MFSEKKRSGYRSSGNSKLQIASARKNGIRKKKRGLRAWGWGRRSIRPDGTS